MLVTPVSNKAKNRFANILRSNVCYVEQDRGDKVFLRSANGKYYFWVKRYGDPNWMLCEP